MKLINDWKGCWRWFSVQAMVLAGAVQAAWVAIPPEWQASIPQEWIRWGTVVLLALGVIGRLVDQGGGDAKSD